MSPVKEGATDGTALAAAAPPTRSSAAVAAAAAAATAAATTTAATEAAAEGSGRQLAPSKGSARGQPSQNTWARGPGRARGPMYFG